MLSKTINNKLQIDELKWNLHIKITVYRICFTKQVEKTRTQRFIRCSFQKMNQLQEQYIKKESKGNPNAQLEKSTMNDLNYTFLFQQSNKTSIKQRKVQESKHSGSEKAKPLLD